MIPSNLFSVVRLLYQFKKRFYYKRKVPSGLGVLSAHLFGYEFTQIHHGEMRTTSDVRTL